MTYADDFNIRSANTVKLNDIANGLDGLLAATTQSISAAGQTLSTTTYATLTGMSQSIAVADGETVVAILNGIALTATAGDAYTYQLLRDSTSLFAKDITSVTNSESNDFTMIAIDKPAAGTYTYSAQGKNATGARNITTYHRNLTVIKLQES